MRQDHSAHYCPAIWSPGLPTVALRLSAGAMLIVSLIVFLKEPLRLGNVTPVRRAEDDQTRDRHHPQSGEPWAAAIIGGGRITVLSGAESV